jgi:hypothetical protein
VAAASSSGGSVKAKLTLWEREQLEASEEHLARQRAATVDKLNAQREQEKEEAQRRQAEFHAQEEQRFAQEEEKRLRDVAQMQAAKEAAVARGKAEKEAQDAEMVEEQARLAQELERKKQAEKAKEEAREVARLQRAGSDDFAYQMEEGMASKVKVFRQRGQGGDAMIIQIDHAANQIQIEEQFKALPSVEAFADKLDETEPRYLLYIHKVVHRDGRTSYPIAFIVYMPEHLPAHLKVMYTRPVVSLAETFKVARHVTLDDPEDLSAEWIEEKLEIRK